MDKIFEILTNPNTPSYVILAFGIGLMIWVVIKTK